MGRLMLFEPVSGVNCSADGRLQAMRLVLFSWAPRVQDMWMGCLSQGCMAGAGRHQKKSAVPETAALLVY